jgi:F420-non-reducing hydrogenase iron-sulfur subunit
MPESNFEPRLVGFLCRWCSYTGADLAGTSRTRYPPNLAAVRVMCSGRVDPTFVVQAFADGADGVLIAGCHPGDCHYSEGNYKALRRFPFLVRLLQQFGIEGERVRMEWVSASEGARFAEVVTEFTAQVRKLGPLAWPARERAQAAAPEPARHA